MMADVLTALVSTIMLTIGDIYEIPYLYLPWLIDTIEGMIFHETPILFELAYNVLPNTSVPKGFFIFLTLIVYGRDEFQNIRLKIVVLFVNG